MKLSTLSLLESLQIPAGVEALASRDGAQLAGRAAASLKPSAASTLLCLEGRLWVTREGDTEDHVLSSGERLELQAGRGVVLSALGGASYALQAS